MGDFDFYLFYPGLNCNTSSLTNLNSFSYI
uniref:Uncharacterized protein n=1 Tax=Geladintestivirus 2 TaxID=3233134 RepID=A0AAU8MM53_9CAUD